jgi:hypothetical protein
MGISRNTVRIDLAGERITLTRSQIELLRFLAGKIPRPPRRVLPPSYQALAAQDLITTSGDACNYRVTRRGEQVFATVERNSDHRRLQPNGSQDAQVSELKEIQAFTTTPIPQ